MKWFLNKQNENEITKYKRVRDESTVVALAMRSRIKQINRKWHGRVRSILQVTVKRLNKQTILKIKRMNHEEIVPKEIENKRTDTRGKE